MPDGEAGHVAQRVVRSGAHPGILLHRPRRNDGRDRDRGTESVIYADARYRETLRTEVEELGREHGVPARLVVLSADPVVALAEVADEVRADAIVVGASEQAGHRLFGSVAVRIVRAGNWPVTVVP